MLALKDLLSRSMKRSGIGRQLEANQVLNGAVTVIEGFLSGIVKEPVYCRGEYFKQGTVFVTVPSGMMAQELRFKEEMLLQQVNAKLGDVIVKRMHVFVGTVEPKPKKL